MISKPYFKKDPGEIFPKDTNEKLKAAKRFNDIKKFLESQKNTYGLAVLEDLLNACIRYIKTIIDLEIELKEIREKYPAAKKYEKAQTQILDKSRQIAHDALIAKRNGINRYLSKKYGWKTKGGLIPPGGICTLRSHHLNIRSKVGDWAWYLIAGLYNM